MTDNLYISEHERDRNKGLRVGKTIIKISKLFSTNLGIVLISNFQRHKEHNRDIDIRT